MKMKKEIRKLQLWKTFFEKKKAKSNFCLFVIQNLKNALENSSLLTSSEANFFKIFTRGPLVVSFLNTGFCIWRWKLCKKISEKTRLENSAKISKIYPHFYSTFLNTVWKFRVLLKHELSRTHTNLHELSRTQYLTKTRTPK